MTGHVLVADIGGTWARLALVAPDGAPSREALPGEPRVVPCTEFASAEHCLHGFLRDQGGITPDTVVLAAAGPVHDGQVAFTNSAWVLDEVALSRAFAGARVRVVNDFEAIAAALPLLTEADGLALGDTGLPIFDDRDLTMAMVGPGTGLGAGALLQRTGAHVRLASEAGHMAFAPRGARQRALLERLSAGRDRVEYEDCCSGPGLERLHRAPTGIDLTPQEHAIAPPAPSLRAAGIFAQAAAGDAHCRDTLDTFFRILGQFAAELVLATGAWDGLWLCGGVLAPHAQALEASAFREAFETGGPHGHLLERVPTAMITHPQPGLLGALAIARDPSA